MKHFKNTVYHSLVYKIANWINHLKTNIMLLFHFRHCVGSAILRTGTSSTVIMPVVTMSHGAGASNIDTGGGSGPNTHIILAVITVFLNPIFGECFGKFLGLIFLMY